MSITLSKDKLVFPVAILLLAGLGFIIFYVYKLITYKPVPGSCLILEEKYCKQLEYYIPSYAKEGYKNPNAAFILPPGTPIFSPFDVTNDPIPIFPQTATQPFAYTLIIHQNPPVDNVATARDYYFYFYFNQNTINRSPKKGEIIDRVSSTPIQGKYNLLVKVLDWKGPTIHPSDMVPTLIDVTQKIFLKK